MQPSEVRSDSALIDTLLEDTRRLLDTLEVERAALQASDGEALQDAVVRKQAQLSALATHLGEPASLERLAQDRHDTAQLCELLQRVRDANLSNGYQIVHRRQFVQDALAALRGQDSNADVYGGDAQLPNTQSARPVAKA